MVGARLMDLENDREIEVRAKVVINAGGVWTNEIQDMLGGLGALDVEASKGIHLVVPATASAASSASSPRPRSRCCS